ncbi:MAG: polysaccharide deacetylase family protein [Deltaproteobacteria bacterium]|nr:polysaccharide deacetylase family protein [Deltaproteobacteria bacterium]
MIILAYHSIAPHGELPLSVKVEEFARQMQYFHEQGCQGCSLEEALASEDRGNGERRVVLTFDDGYGDNYANAFPVLARLGFTATIFVAVSFVGSRRTFPWHSRTSPRPLDWGEIAEMAQQGIVFGSHTLSHPDLTQIPVEDAWREIAQSKDILEQRLGLEVTSFSYPKGKLSREIQEMVQAAGYKQAVALRPPQGAAPGRFALPRLEVSARDSSPVFRFKVSRLYQKLTDWGLDGYLNRNWFYSLKKKFSTR